MEQENKNLDSVIQPTQASVSTEISQPVSMPSELPAESKKSGNIVYGIVSILFGVIAYNFPYIILLVGDPTSTFSAEGAETPPTYFYYILSIVLSSLGIFFAFKAIKASKTNSFLGLSGLIVCITALLTYASQLIIINRYI
ncbi:hypothetical protein KA043_01755 [Candidatus Saccharibacteria bacterium]|nr:hypothetical protein [Candidatus Saccharibacteria bacterium]